MKRAAVQAYFCSFEIKRFEKRKTHEMIPVGMGKQEVYGIIFFFGQFVAKSSYSGSRINHNEIAAFGTDLQTGRITAVFQIFFSGDGNGSPRSPAFDVHGYPFRI